MKSENYNLTTVVTVVAWSWAGVVPAKRDEKEVFTMKTRALLLVSSAQFRSYDLKMLQSDNDLYVGCTVVELGSEKFVPPLKSFVEGEGHRTEGKVRRPSYLVGVM